MGRNSFCSVFLFSLIACTDVIAENSCSSENISPMVQLKRHLLCEYDPDVRPVQHNNNMTRVNFYLKPQFFEYVSNNNNKIVIIIIISVKMCAILKNVKN